MKKRKKISLFDLCNVLFMLLVMVIILYPLYFTVIASISDAKAVAMGEVIWLPMDFTLDAYKHVFTYEQIWIGYLNTIIYTVFGTIFNLLLTIPTAYMLSKKYLPGRNGIMVLFLITMYFGGGMVPSYLLIKGLGLLDTRFVLILVGGISVYNLIVTKTYFSTSVSESLYEAAQIDGAGEIKRFVSIGLPLAKPIIAVMVLYYAVGHWNSYFDALIYVNKKELEPLQLVLRKVLIMNQNALNKAIMTENVDAEQLHLAARQAYAAYTMKYAMVFIASLPLLIAYPFVQKHFVKGVMIGAIKE